jgi:hypothetical protein
MEDLIKALQIFLKYGNKNYPTFCEHDILYVDVDPSVVSDEDKKVLDELGFFVYDENDCFASFKYGSM